ncbi:hypothetical protein RQP46_007275 [Phenoliferia psychrophenolica]
MRVDTAALAQSADLADSVSPPQESAGVSQVASSGDKRALCIGIEYGGSQNALPGCHADAMRISQLLMDKYGYAKEQIMILTDRPGGTYPTTKNIIRCMHWLVQDAKPDDSLFFSYSGYGGQVPDLDGDEPDGLDEMHDIMVRPLPKNCRLTALFDCSYSASMLDLPFTYSTEGKLKKSPSYGTGLPKANQHAYRSKYLQPRSLLTSAQNIFHNRPAVRKGKSSEAHCVSWAACKECADGTPSAGAMTSVFIEALTEDAKTLTYKKLLVLIRDKLSAQGYDQKPQLSCSHALDCDTEVKM